MLVSKKVRLVIGVLFIKISLPAIKLNESQAVQAQMVVAFLVLNGWTLAADQQSASITAGMGYARVEIVPV